MSQSVNPRVTLQILPLVCTRLMCSESYSRYDEPTNSFTFLPRDAYHLQDSGILPKPGNGAGASALHIMNPTTPVKIPASAINEDRMLDLLAAQDPKSHGNLWSRLLKEGIVSSGQMDSVRGLMNEVVNTPPLTPANARSPSLTAEFFRVADETVPALKRAMDETGLRKTLGEKAADRVLLWITGGTPSENHASPPVPRAEKRASIPPSSPSHACVV